MFETKEQILEKILAQPKPKCSHCQEEMHLWEVPPMNFSDGLGWGTPYMYVCFNDTCPLYESGWSNLQENFAQNASYRCACYPDTFKEELLPVFSPFGGKGQIVDDQVLAEQEALKEAIKKGFSILASCYTDNDWPTVMRILMDGAEPVRVRLKAAEMIGDFGELEAIDALRNSKFGHQKLQESVDKGISEIHKRYYTRECPFCAEIIKKRASICKHCSKEVAGM